MTSLDLQLVSRADKLIWTVIFRRLYVFRDESVRSKAHLKRFSKSRLYSDIANVMPKPHFSRTLMAHCAMSKQFSLVLTAILQIAPKLSPCCQNQRLKNTKAAVISTDLRHWYNVTGFSTFGLVTSLVHYIPPTSNGWSSVSITFLYEITFRNQRTAAGWWTTCVIALLKPSVVSRLLLLLVFTQSYMSKTFFRE